MELAAADLVQRLKKRDGAAFDEVYRLYHPRIYRFLMDLCRRREVADDLFQETWLAVARSADKIADDTDLAAWLFTIARNKHRSHRRWAILHWLRADEPSPDLPGDAPLPDDATGARREADALARALGELPEASREVLLLACVEGLSAKELGVVLGVSEEAARKRLSRARAELAGKLEARKDRGGAVR